MDVSGDIVLENKNNILYHYDNVLNKDKSTYKSSNDETTPLDCVKEMIQSIPESFWEKQNLKILDPCCGNGNFHLIIFYKLLSSILSSFSKSIRSFSFKLFIYFFVIAPKRLSISFVPL